MGLGATGFSCARYLYHLGVEVTVFDTSAKPPFFERLTREIPDVTVQFGAFDEQRFKEAEVLVLSPGVSLTDPAIAYARDAGVEIVGDIELFCRAASRPVIGITGSNGKSTVTTLTDKLLTAAGVKVLTGGNIGRPALDLLDENSPSCYVLELSSFQLETTSSLSAHVAAILNISPDHMNRYPDLNAYIAAKTRIAASASTLVVNRDDPTLKDLAVSHSGEVVTFGLNSPPGRKDLGLILRDRKEWLARGDRTLLPATDLRIQGRHNVANALAAVAISEAIVGEMSTAPLEALREFSGLPHRCEIVSEIHGVRWINDSKGTNVGATVTALEGMGYPVVLIVGGQAKDADFSPLAQAVDLYARHVILFGEDREQIGAQISGMAPVTIVETFIEAVTLSADCAQSGDTVLFSPACASFDMFDNFEHRGDSFRELVSRLEQ